MFAKENCRKGMDNYLHEYNGGELITLANRIEDEGQYINEVKKKFDADSANWVWTKETADKKIAEVIVEYSIVDESNKINGKAKTLREAFGCVEILQETFEYLRCIEELFSEI